MSKKPKQKLPKERNPFVEQMRARGKAVHGKSKKAERRQSKIEVQKQRLSE